MQGQIIKRRQPVFHQVHTHFKDTGDAGACPMHAHGLVKPQAVVGEVVEPDGKGQQRERQGRPGATQATQGRRPPP